MKKWLMVFAALLPLTGMANMLNSTNDLNKPGYNPSQQRMQTQMLNQSQQQQTKLQQDQQRQNQDVQRKLQEQRDSAQQRVIKSQPGQQQNQQNMN
ncbi:DUF2756 domain-containing protein [Pantoea stewartii]|uniref:DUF2756 domain-containing protein n=1 Tax=Pantoea stewartii subsp. stewartii DC283 TaxID=660596 RepID=H3RHR1_PANSE|nr:DUF2756 domain-containing protein [Pantoea stewartii]ARF48123.1 hypothetical protein DSJ_01165 [Pantoea stewartii subsp. stewartii DC283]EHT99006.1 hypothetical protein CKS_0912 [Pantoea stewartii subsp. stewartii DC283]KAB0558495.1 DUF2756 domain-containing protein [Pantoea stewartii subsp. stewartii]